MPAFLMVLAAGLAGSDAVWALAGHFSLDWAAYFRLGLLAVALMGAARIYQTVRPDPRLAAMLLGTGFLCAFSLGASVLNYLLLTRAGARIDLPLAALDRALGFDWPHAMAWMAQHPRLNGVAFAAYSSMLPQVALITIALAAREPQAVYRFCMSVAIGALICIAVWTLAPSFGAFSVYPAPAMTLALDSHYARDLVRLLQDGPGLISPRDAQGLIGFPSYHAVLALLVTAHGWRIKYLRLPLVLLNGAVLLATPIQGGHHLMDVLGALPVAAIAFFVTRANIFLQNPAKARGMVNKERKFTPNPIPQGLFRIMPEQSDVCGASAIKPKLSGVP